MSSNTRFLDGGSVIVQCNPIDFLDIRRSIWITGLLFAFNFSGYYLSISRPPSSIHMFIVTLTLVSGTWSSLCSLDQRLCSLNWTPKKGGEKGEERCK
jgi:hypothetical protein